MISSSRLRKSLRSLLLAAALALVALVVRDYVDSTNSESRLSPDRLPVLPKDIAAQSHSWRWTQTTGDSTHIEVSAEDFAQASGGLETDLRGVSLKIFRADTGTYDLVKSPAMRMLADGNLYSDGETVISIGLAAEGDSGPQVVVSSSGVTFQPDANSARTERPVRYEFDGGAGRSVGAVYDAGSGTLDMLSQVELERFSSGHAPSAKIRAGSLRYSEQAARIELKGGSRLERGSQWLECSASAFLMVDGAVRHLECAQARGGELDVNREVRFFAPFSECDFGSAGELRRVSGQGGTTLESAGTEQELDVSSQVVELRYEPGLETGRSHLKQIEARGGAEARMDSAQGNLRSSLESEALLLHIRPESSQIEQVETLARGRLRQFAEASTGPTRILDAGRIRLHYGDSSALEALEANGSASFVQRSGEPGASELRTWSEQLQAAFDPATSEISRFRQSGAFRFKERGRTGAAVEASFDPTGGRLELDGDASVSGDGSEVAAQRIVVNRESGRLEAHGEVIGSLAPGGGEGDEAVPEGLFAGEGAVFLAAESLTSDPERRILECRDAARLWQGPSRIDADTITIDQAKRRVVANGSVSATWAAGESDQSAQPSLATVRSDRMAYEERDGQARFNGAVEFRRQGMRVLSEKLQTALGDDGSGSVRRAVAEGAVRIAQDVGGFGHRGFGDFAEFDLADSEVFLSGRPARIEAADGTRSEGSSLTYRVSGDSLQVSGDGATRAYTYRPASQ